MSCLVELGKSQCPTDWANCQRCFYRHGNDHGIYQTSGKYNVSFIFASSKVIAHASLLKLLDYFNTSQLYVHNTIDFEMQTKWAYWEIMYYITAWAWVYMGIWYKDLYNWKRTLSLSSGSTGTWSYLWRHNGGDGVSNHQPHDCLLNRSFRRRSKNTSNPRVTGLCDR